MAMSSGLSVALMLPEFFGGEGGISGNRVQGQAFLGITFGPQIQLYYLIALYCFICTAAMFALFTARHDPAFPGDRDEAIAAALEIAERAGLKVTRNLVGSYITSLEMAGTSITLLKLDDQLTKLWDATVHTPALRWGI